MSKSPHTSVPARVLAVDDRCSGRGLRDSAEHDDLHALAGAIGVRQAERFSAGDAGAFAITTLT